MPASSRLKVLQLGKYYWPYRGGVETIVKSMSENLQKQVDVEVLVADHGACEARSSIQGVAVSRVKPWCTLSSASLCPGMVRRIRQSRADLVHLHIPNPGGVLAFLASGVKTPLVLSYHADIVRQKMMGRMFEPIQQELLRRASAILVASQELLEGAASLQSHIDRCHVVPFGIATSGLEQPNHDLISNLRATYGPRMVLSVGRMVYYKGFEHLIRAMRDVEGHLVIAGNGPLRTDLEDRIRVWGLGDKVTLLAGIDDLDPYYCAAEVFVLPSTERAEAFGIVQLEAMVRCKPVVNTSIPTGVPGVSLDGITGFTVPPADPTALASAINRLLDDSELRARFGAAGRNRARAVFGLNDMIERTLEIYAAALGLDSAPCTGAERSARSLATTRSTENRSR